MIYSMNSVIFDTGRSFPAACYNQAVHLKYRLSQRRKDRSNICS